MASTMSILPNSGKSFNAMQSHAFVPADSNKLLLEMFGRPDGPYMLSNEALQRNLQPDDILGQYMGRELTLYSQAITAAVLNDRSSIMLLIFPLVETLETQFSIQYLEPNMVPWSRVTNFGIPRETTYSQWSESYTTQRKKQMARIEKNFLLDPNYGRAYWEMMTRNLGGNAKMTLIIDACVQAIEQPFRNMFQDQNKQNAVDHNRLFNAEMADFGIAGRNPDLFYKALIKHKPHQLPIPFDTILSPEGVFQQLKQNASDGGPIPCERAELSAETNRIHAVIFNGPSSTKRINVGGRTIELIEVPPLYCNSQDTSVKVFRPFESTLTYADIIPFDIGTKNQQYTDPVGERFDRFAYVQTPTNGHQSRFEFRRALDNMWLYDRTTGAPSKYYEGFIAQLNMDMVQNSNANIPLEWVHTSDVNDEPAEGVDTFTPEMIKDSKGDLKAMRGFREWFPFATFDPQQRRWRRPLHMGDNHQRNLTNERIRQAAVAVLSTLPSDERSTAVFNDIADLVTSIRRERFTKQFVEALIAENSPYMVDAAGSLLPDTANRHDRDTVPQWYPNEFGSLRLPKHIPESQQLGNYPPGFGSWAGIQTLALEADDVSSIYRLAGEHARRVVRAIENLYATFSQYMPESELVDGRNTAPWFHVDDGGRSVLLDTIVQLKTGEKRPAPALLAMKRAGASDTILYPEAKKNATATYTDITDAGIDALGQRIAEGEVLFIDDYLALGSVVPAGSMGTIKKIAEFFADIESKNVTIKQPNTTATSTAPSKRILEKIKPEILAAIGKLTPFANQALLRDVEGILSGEKADGTTDEEFNGSKLIGIYTLITQYKNILPKKGAAAVAPFFDLEAREKALEAARSKTLYETGAPKAFADNFFMRAPLEASGDIKDRFDPNNAIGGGLIYSAKGVARAALSKGNEVYNAHDNILNYPFALNGVFGDSVQSSSSVGGRVPFAAAASSGTSASLADMFSSVMYSGRDEVAKAADRRGYFPASSAAAEDTVTKGKDGVFSILGTDGSLFGPWAARLKWLRQNVSNGIERIAALAILLSRNTLQTHRALSDVGAALLRIDGWRTGITTKTAAIVRLVRGASTAFAVLARISVVPTLEGVTGDHAIVGEMFHGIVFQNRKHIDLLMNAVLLEHIGGKGDDAVEVPEHLDMNADQGPSVLYMPDSENASRIEYPRHMLNENFYYNSNSGSAPSPYRKVAYADFARYVLGKRVDAFSNAQLDKSFYSGKIRRSLVGNRTATYGYNNARRDFSNREAGSSVTGSIELNTADAWRGSNGGIFPVLAEDRPVPN